MKCGWCDGEKEIVRKLPDGEGLCSACDRRLRLETRGYPDCPHCKHRFWLSPYVRGGGYKCLGCGGHVPPGGSLLNDEEERWPRYQHPFIDHTGLG